MKTVRLDEMTWTDVKEQLESGVDTVVFGVGSTEQHGPALPLQTDGRIADFAANMLAIQLDKALQAPTIRVGYSGHHLSFPGTISIQSSTLQAIISDYVDSLVHHGFKKLVITNHHGGNCQAIEASLAEMRQKYPDMKFVYFYDQETTEALGKLCHQFQITPGELGTHAGDMEASIMLYLEEDLVKPDRFVRGYTNGITPEMRALAQEEGYHTISETGVVGDQIKATREKGLEYYNALKDVILGYVKRELKS